MKNGTRSREQTPVLPVGCIDSKGDVRKGDVITPGMSPVDRFRARYGENTEGGYQIGESVEYAEMTNL